jgi:cellulase/cellobiase CelA1
VFVLYNLPNRDCAAFASAGEICCTYAADGGRCDLLAQEGGCDDGMWEYREQFVKPFARLLQQYTSSVPIAVIIEPDSLPNLVTSGANPRCGDATRQAYVECVAFAVSHLATMVPAAALYLDAGHGGWLGWDAKAAAFARLVCSELEIDMRLLRGFATNVANYNPIGTPCPREAFRAPSGAKSPLSSSGSKATLFCAHPTTRNHTCCQQDPCGRLARYSSGATETMFVQTLAKHFSEQCDGYEPHFVIDTSRSGESTAHAPRGCQDWCNLKAAGAGFAPTTATGLASIDGAPHWP